MNFLSRFFKSDVKPFVLEIEKDLKLPELTNELRESLKTLPNHPAFHYLLAKMRVERATLQKYLHEGFSLTEAQLHHLQAGVHYLGWIESELARNTKLAEVRIREVTSHEEEVFKTIASNVEQIF